MGDDSYSKRETEQRAEEALKRMLQTPHKPHKPIGKKCKKLGKAPAGRGRPARKRAESER